jgi:hypothetical protein
MAALLILTLCLVLSSCGRTPRPQSSPAPLPQPTVADEQAAIEALILCFHHQVPVVDDTRSDARAIVETVFLACEQEYQTAVETHWHILVARGALAPDTKPLFFETMQSSMKRRILGAVLDYRRTRREHL